MTDSNETVATFDLQAIRVRINQAFNGPHKAVAADAVVRYDAPALVMEVERLAKKLANVRWARDRWREQCDEQKTEIERLEAISERVRECEDRAYAHYLLTGDRYNGE